MLLKCFPLCSLLSPHCVLLALSSRGEWSGWLSCLSGCSQGKAFPVCSLVLQLRHMKCSPQPVALTLGPACTCKARLPGHFHRNSSPVRNSSVLQGYWQRKCPGSFLQLSEFPKFTPPLRHALGFLATLVVRALRVLSWDSLFRF